MNKKKVLLVVLAMVLVCALSVMGTMALLTEQRGTVTNTFVAAVPGGEQFVTNFEIKEYKVAADDAGNYDYVLESGAKVETNANSYIVTPGVTLPKDAFVELSRTNTTPAYLFIEVDNNLDSTAFSMGVASAWGKLDGVTGNNGGDVYVLGTAAAPTVLKNVTNGEYHIIDGNKVTVDNNAVLNITKDSTDTINFYAYICQATVAKADGTNTSNPAEVFAICFPAQSGN